MGRVSAPFGVKGWIKVQPFTAAINSLAAYDSWWLGRDGDWQECRIEHAQAQGRQVVAKPAGCDDREAALRLRGKQVAVGRDTFPQTAANEFYWADLIGLRVVNGDAADFGSVIRILETGANAVLVVASAADKAGSGRERLIPFIANVIREVDPAAGVIRVEWGEDY